MKQRPMLVLLGTLMIGELTAEKIDKEILVIFSVVFIFVFYVYQSWKICLLGMLLFGYGLASHRLMDKQLSYVESFKDYEVDLKGYVYYLEEQAYGWNIYIENVNLDGMKIKFQKVLLTIEETPNIIPGDTISGTVSINDAKQDMNPGGFDQKAYYRSLGIAFTGKLKTYAIENRENRLVQFLLRVKEKWKYILDYSFGEYGSLYQGILLGDGKLIDGELKELFQRNGIGHILAISGLHLSLLGMSFYQLLRKKLGVGTSSFLVLSVCFAFCYVTGGGVSTIRAVILLVLHFLGDFLGRSKDQLTQLSFAAFIILIEYPGAVMQVGFQLSFVCATGIMIFIPRLLLYLQPCHKITKSLLVSFMLQIFLLPINAYYFYESSIYGFLINLVVIPMMGIVLMSGLVTIAIGSCFIFLAPLGAGPGYVVLKIYQILCEVSDQMPYHTNILGKPSLIQVVGLYLLLYLFFIFCRFITQKDEKDCILPWNIVRIRYIITSVVIGIILVGARYIQIDDILIQQLYVGQGDCCVIREREGQTIMIDCGSSSDRDIAQNVMNDFFKSQGIKKVDVVFLTHPDIDHINGALSLIQNDTIPVSMVIMPDFSGHELYEELKQVCNEHNILLKVMKKGDYYKTKYMTFTCLSPVEGICSETNENSLVLLINAFQTKLLYTGDVGIEEENQFCEELFCEEIDILKVAHHGSKESSGNRFLTRIKPTYSLISAGIGNRYQHPHGETIERLKNVNSCILYTWDRCIQIHITKKGWSINHYEKN